jgi:hypothetical protein
MKWVIWNKTKDAFWDAREKEWSNRYYATKYTYEELETAVTSKWFGSEGDLILGIIAIHV